MERLPGNWQSSQKVDARAFKCGYCGNKVASQDGWVAVGGTFQSSLRVCPSCNRPSLFYGEQVLPSPAAGNEVNSLPVLLEALYTEARRCTSVGGHTGAVLLCRKILMHVAVDKGAKEGLNFVQYVNYLWEQHYITPDGKAWVDHIRQRGNEANHEIVLMTAEHSSELTDFTEMLLRLIYELPGRLPAKTP